LEALIQTFKTAAKGLTLDADRKFMQEVWLERPHQGSRTAGGKDSKQVSNKYLILS
jgi:hypothetical protein